MLYEDDVIDAVCDHLRSRGFTISHQCASTMRGDDIVAHGTGRIRDLYIEAKGETSNRKGSLRHGHPFDSSQVLVHVAAAFYRSAKMATNGRVGGIALPANEAHQERVSAIAHALEHLGIIVFWVASDRSVRTSTPLLP